MSVPRSWGWTVTRLMAAGVALFVLMLALGVLLVHVLVRGWVGSTDDAIERHLLADRTPTWNSLTSAGTQLAQPLTVAAAVAVAVIALALVTRRWAPPVFLTVTVGIESAVYFGTSTLVHRDRPSIARLGMGDPRASYPSGHVAASACLYGGFHHLSDVLAGGVLGVLWLTATTRLLLLPGLRRDRTS